MCTIIIIIINILIGIALNIPTIMKINKRTKKIITHITVINQITVGHILF